MKNKMKKDDVILIRVDSEFKNRVERFAQSQDRSVSSAARYALEKLMQQQAQVAQS